MSGKRVVYIGSGDPVRPRKGMDLVLQAHLAELSTMADVTFTGVIVAPARTGFDLSSATVPTNGVDLYEAEPGSKSKWKAVLQKLTFVLGGGALPSLEYRSGRAKRVIEYQLRDRPDVVVIDHFFSLANVSLRTLRRARRRGAKIVYICHDITPKLMRDVGALRKSVVARLVYRTQARVASAVEGYLLRSCSLAVFISAYDKAVYGARFSSPAIALCPLVAAVPPSPERYGPVSSQLLFVGAPNFAPNEFALRWICEKLAPALYELNPEVEIVLAGKGTDGLGWIKGPNIRALGFVDDHELARLLAQSRGVLSPIVHGSGLKIKVLDAIVANSPVFATAESLRGFEFMEIPPTLIIDDVEKSARVIAKFTKDEELQRETRSAMFKRWNEYACQREGALARRVTDLITV